MNAHNNVEQCNYVIYLYVLVSSDHVFFADSGHVIHCIGHIRVNFPKSILTFVAIDAPYTHTKGERSISHVVIVKNRTLNRTLKWLFLEIRAIQCMKFHPNFVNRHRIALDVYCENFVLRSRRS